MFSNKPPDGYCHGSDIAAVVQTAAEDDDEVFYPSGPNEEDANNRSGGITPPCLYRPFSAITPSMWPQDLTEFNISEQHKDPNHQPEFRFDEFGFRIEEEDGPEQSSRRLLSLPLSEDPRHKLRWAAEVNVTSLNDSEGEVSWEGVPASLPHTDKLRSLVMSGVPHSFRPQIWMRLSGAMHKKQSANVRYEELISASSNDMLSTNRQIEKDLLRTLPNNACFSHSSATGVPRLRRLLRAIAWFYPDIGYCQGMGMIAANILLFLEEEDAFWLMCTIVEDLLPASYYSSTLMGVQADQRVLQSLVSTCLPALSAVMKEHDIELSLITLHWFVTVFSSVLHLKLLLRVWDLLFLDGSVVLFKITLAMLKIKEAEIRSLDNSADIFNSLSDIPRDLDDADCLIKMMETVSSGVCEVMLETQRRKQLVTLMADHGTLINPHNPPDHLPKQHLHRRSLNGTSTTVTSSWLLANFLPGGDTDDLRTKNVRQTELLVDLREAVLQVARHFQSTEPSLSHISLAPDYSLESHSKDLQQFMATAVSRRRRAKALLDFERHDQDELGFRKNDIITIISQRDEHCWVGELNGLRGWFPAKFVEVLDERSKQYSAAGDDAVNSVITDLVRGSLCSAVKALLLHGMKRSPILGGGVWHPWLFLEEAADKEIAPDFPSVYSRLVLCRTFRLDQDAKVLQPEELLYRCIEAVNATHNAAHAQMDVKLRSLICMGLNEQVLHLWLECVCSQAAVIEKWYHPWSFLRSPGWVQIKCELRVLAQFSFNLNPDWELPSRRGQDELSDEEQGQGYIAAYDRRRISTLMGGQGGSEARQSSASRLRRSSSASSIGSSASHAASMRQPLREGVRDLLVKHHLFSWDL